MTNHTAALSFARDTTVYAHASAKEDVDNLKRAYLELREVQTYVELLARLDNAAEAWKAIGGGELCSTLEHSAAAIRNIQAAYTAAKSEADLYANKLTKAERHRINAEENFAAAEMRRKELEEDYDNISGQLAAANEKLSMIDLLEVYMVEGNPRFAVHGNPGGPDYFLTARSALDAAFSRAELEKHDDL